MTQPPDGIQRDADLYGITPTLPPTESPLVEPPSEFAQTFPFVFLAIAIYLLQPVWTSVAFTILRNAGFYAWYYGPDFASQDQTRLQLWAITAALPCWLGSAAVLLCGLPAFYRRDIGVSLSPRRPDGSRLEALGVNLLIGLLAWLVLTPVTLGLNWCVVSLHTHFIEVAPREHPFTAMAESGALRPMEWALLALSVSLSAPLWEELFFRGALLALCRKLTDRGGHAAMLLALAVAILLRREQFIQAGPSIEARLVAALPALFVLALVPFYLVVCRLSRTGDAPIIFGTALLFGMVHSFAWPTPVALFVLGLGLSWLALRTRSLVAPIVVHSLFNAVSFALLFFT